MPLSSRGPAPSESCTGVEISVFCCFYVLWHPPCPLVPNLLPTFGIGVIFPGTRSLFQSSQACGQAQPPWQHLMLLLFLSFYFFLVSFSFSHPLLFSPNPSSLDDKKTCRNSKGKIEQQHLGKKGFCCASKHCTVNCLSLLAYTLSLLEKMSDMFI